MSWEETAKKLKEAQRIQAKASKPKVSFEDRVKAILKKDK